jgi:hypothetical protein
MSCYFTVSICSPLPNFSMTIQAYKHSGRETTQVLHNDANSRNCCSTSVALSDAVARRVLNAQLLLFGEQRHVVTGDAMRGSAGCAYGAWHWEAR